MSDKPEQVILDTAILEKLHTIDTRGHSTLDIYDPSEGHLLALMRAQDEFHGEYGGFSDGHLSLTYFDQGESGAVINFEEYDAHHLRILIALVPTWVWRGTRVSLEINE